MNSWFRDRGAPGKHPAGVTQRDRVTVHREVPPNARWGGNPAREVRDHRALHPEGPHHAARHTAAPEHAH